MSASDMVMALGDPIIVFVLASLPNGTLYLAAFALGKGVAVFFESPIISILPTSNAMAGQAKTRQLLLRFVLLLGSGLTAAMLLTGSLINIPALFQINQSVWEAALLLILLLCPWPLAIALRRFWQGQIIRAGFSGLIAKGSLLRCLLLAATAFIMAAVTDRGEWIAAGALLTGVFGELLFIRYQAIKIALVEETPKSSLPINLSEMGHYYWPLAQSMLSLWGARLLLPFFIATTGELFIAVWAAGWALVISVSNGVRMVQQLVIRNINHIARESLCYFSLGVGGAFSFILFCMAVTPWGKAFCRYYGGSQLLGDNISNVILAACLLPLLMSLQNYLQGLLMVKSLTKEIGRSALIANGLMVLGALLFTQQGYPPYWIALIVSMATTVEVCLLAFYLKSNEQSQSGKRFFTHKSINPS